jgi:protein-S-isoprenylcysteine O-methyltransferase Ste14
MGPMLQIARALMIIVTVWLAIAWLTGLLRPLDSSLGVELPAWVQAPALLVVLVGVAGVLTCGVMLSTRGIGTLRGDEWFMPKEFVVSGPFRFVRNPMSLSGAFLMTGIALWHRSPFGLGLAVALFLVFHMVVVYLEEPGLDKRFGDSYREYRRNVPRWVPRITPWHRSSAEQIVPTDRPCQ